VACDSDDVEVWLNPGNEHVNAMMVNALSGRGMTLWDKHVLASQRPVLNMGNCCDCNIFTG
jgi:hypothetical protein